MKTDLSGSLRLLLDSAVGRARRLEYSQQPLAAAEACDEAARFTEQIASSANTPAEQQRRLASAHGFRQLALKLREKARCPQPGSEAPVTEGDSLDEHRATVQGLIHRSTISWQDIAGLDETKIAIQTAYALSLAKAPVGVRLHPVRNILLYGPPGNGKTLIAAACSHALDATFFNVKVSQLLSKYFGESSKLVTALFEEARRRAPSVVFFDEVDALTGTRHGHDVTAERRMLANLLSELDGVSEKDSQQYVMTIAATNMPWAMDPAILSRFERKILIPLPDTAARERILQLHLEERGYSVEGGLTTLIEHTEGYSGRELERIAKLLVEKMLQVRNPGLPRAAAQGRAAIAAYQIQVTSITRSVVNGILASVRPETTPTMLQRFTEFSSPTNSIQGDQ